MQRRDFIKNIATVAGVGTCASLLPPCKQYFFGTKKKLTEEDLKILSKDSLPRRIRLEACSLCQLKCPACWVREQEEKIKKEEGFGYLKFKDFKKLVDENPQINEIELSYSGEIFLNPELKQIIEYAYENGIRLKANGGANLNTLSDEMAETLVKCQFDIIRVSMDAATSETYEIYRRGGNFENVIKNIQKINKYKKEYNSVYPMLVLQFIVFKHNMYEILQARELVRVLNMKISFVHNIVPSYSRLNEEDKKYIENMTDLKFAKKENALREIANSYKKNNQGWYYCEDLFVNPQINWNGNLLGCIIYQGKNFGVNVFKEGLLNALNHKNVLYAKRMLTDFSVSPKEELPCSTCGMYKSLKEENYELYSDKKII
ncbi:MAG: radical SAM protein [bacterium]|nr:radical SAM protein [bacterium]